MEALYQYYIQMFTAAVAGLGGRLGYEQKIKDTIALQAAQGGSEGLGEFQGDRFGTSKANLYNWIIYIVVAACLFLAVYLTIAKLFKK